MNLTIIILRIATTQPGSCGAIANGEVKETPIYATFDYTYEVAISENTTSEAVVGDMQSALGMYVGIDLLECDERLLLQQVQARRLEGMELVGIDPATPPDEASDDSCEFFIGGNIIGNTKCHVVKGGMTLYFSDSGNRRLVYQEESTENALNTMEDGMGADSPFLEYSGSKYSVKGVAGLQFMGGTTRNGMAISGASGADSGNNLTRSSNMEAVGISLLAVGVVTMLIVGAVVHKRRSSTNSYNEFEDDYDDDLADKDTVLDETMSVTSSPPRKVAYVMGEEESVYTTSTYDTRHVVPTFGNVEIGNDNDDGQKKDVHRCTSALCPICKETQTNMLSVNAVNDEDTIETEGYEHDYNKSFESYEFEPKVKLQSPGFDNPAQIERSYEVDDTVDF